MCLSEESAAVIKRPSSSTTRDPVRRRAADCFRSPSTSYHVWTIIGNINVPTSLDGGGLYALRAGRCGCDSLSLAGSRQRVKSLRSAVRLRLVIHTARSILSRRVLHYVPHTSSEGSQKSETVPYAIAPVTDSPEEDVSVRSRYPVLRSCIRVPSSWFPRSRRSLKSPSSEPLQPLRLHTPHQLVRAAGLLRFTVPGIVP